MTSFAPFAAQCNEKVPVYEKQFKTLLSLAYRPETRRESRWSN